MVTIWRFLFCKKKSALVFIAQSQVVETVEIKDKH